MDTGAPTFTNPTAVSNPLLPVSAVSEVILLGSARNADGKLGDDQLRVEISRLPGTRTVEYDGRRATALISQVVGYRNGRIAEVSQTFLSQADDGSVWSLGRDVANYDDGKLTDSDGTWIAGKSASPAMVMPANPKIGDAFRSENVKGGPVVESTVKDTGLTVDGAKGPIRGAVLVRETRADGTVTDRTYAPGYGEVQTKVGATDETRSLAVAVPPDFTPGTVPAPLTGLTASVVELGKVKAPVDWAAAGGSVERLAQTWKEFAAGPVPTPLRSQVDENITALRDAVSAEKLPALHQAALDVGILGLDLQLQFRPQTDVDRERASLWALRVKIDAEARDLDSVKGDIASLNAIWDRSSHAFGRDKARAEAPLNEIRGVTQISQLPGTATSASAFIARLSGN